MKSPDTAQDTALDTVREPAPDATHPAVAAGQAGHAGHPPRDIARVMISCVVPAYNECKNLGVLLPALQAVLGRTQARWDVIVVDDGSRDATSTLMTAWTRNPGFRTVQLSRNFGKEPAITAGLQAATGDVVIILDADMQHPPDLVPAMLERWQAGVDMVYAVRENRKDEGWGKRFGTRMFYSLMAGSHGVQVPPHAGDFRLMDRAVVDALLQLPERNRFMKGLYAWVGFPSEPITYTPDNRQFGETHFSHWKLLRLALAGLTAFTTWPLRAVSIKEAPASPSASAKWRAPVRALACILLFFSGINLISLGIVGEYIGRIFDEVKGRPLYIVRQMSGQSFNSGGQAQEGADLKAQSLLSAKVSTAMATNINNNRTS